MAILKCLYLICSIIVLAAISIPVGHSRPLKPKNVEGIIDIEETCNQTIDNGYCIQLLQGDSLINHWGLRGQAFRLLEEITRKAFDALRKVNQLLVGKIDEALTSCSEDLDAIVVVDIPKATQALKSRDLKSALEAVLDVSLKLDKCEIGFYGRHSPIIKESSLLKIAIKVAIKVIKLLLKF
ncbi:uncharacterized protein LOC130725627 [Lotus japonicus]|uniref:uncharacterized protein LOC130725627 n=1 Tax=Lotus japonicus TaxID=34305 RepID=UPI0025842923|nr:uncharacterized protein LOC130725627 [Lotus japonicus]